MTTSECKMKKEKCKMRRARRLLLAFFILPFSLFTGSGCRQKMADQPYFRPLTESDMFEDGRASRPLERGVIHRAQALETDPLVTGLTREEWAAFYSHAAELRDAPAPKVDPGLNADQLQEANKKIAFGAPRYDPPGFTPGPGQPPQPGHAVYTNEFPFPITKDDLVRGQERYTIYCAVCHGPLGNGHGKIWERGYLQPTSFHTAPVSDEEKPLRDLREGVWYDEQPSKKTPVRLGYSRGYSLWGIKIPMRDVPVGYYFEVITKGYAGMPSYSAQIPPADRWKIIAYVRVLQLSQHADKTQLPQTLQNKLNAGGGKQP